MKLDLRNVQTTDFGGNVEVRDISKELANIIYKMTPDLGELDFAQDLYRNGEVEMSEANMELVKKYLEDGQFLAFVKKAVYNMIDNNNNKQEE